MRLLGMNRNQSKNIYLNYKCNLEQRSETQLIHLYHHTQYKEEQDAILLIFKERGYSQQEIKTLLLAVS